MLLFINVLLGFANILHREMVSRRPLNAKAQRREVLRAIRARSVDEAPSIMERVAELREADAEPVERRPVRRVSPEGL